MLLLEQHVFQEYLTQEQYFSTDNYASTVSPSKLEQFKSQKQSEIEKAERWEEFLKLKNDLKQYLEAKIKLTK